jgi:hemoglobin-like flavoprotein
MARFTREMLEFVAFGEPDVAAIRRTAPVVLSHSERITAALYDHFLTFPRSARFFLREDGGVDRDRLERRKHSLGRWLRESAQAAMTEEFSYYLLSVGIAHSHRAQGPGGMIPAHLMIGAMSLTQSTLAAIFDADLDREQASAAAVAWNKLLFVHLAVMMLSYLPPRPLP